MGFDAWFVARIDYEDKEKRLENKEMEMIMTPPQLSGESHNIFTHVNYFNYAAPPNFDFNIRSGIDTEPIIDDPSEKDYNID